MKWKWRRTFLRLVILTEAVTVKTMQKPMNFLLMMRYIFYAFLCLPLLCLLTTMDWYFYIQLMDSMTSFRFIEPEVIIKEFSIEHLKAMKSQRYDKCTLSLICPVCDKNFQRNSHLKRHLLIHTKEKVRKRMHSNEWSLFSPNIFSPSNAMYATENSISHRP